MQFIVISALGSDRTGLVYDLTRVVLDCAGNIVDSRMSAFGNEFAMLLLVSGNWHTLAKLETELKKLSDSTGITVSLRRTEQRPARKDMVTYSVDVVCLDQPGIVHNLAGFFSSRGIDIAEHWRAGRPVHVWRDGRVVALFPDGTAQPVQPPASPSTGAASRFGL